MSAPDRADDLWRDAAPQIIGALVRRYGDFEAAEDATQEAMLAASRQWPQEGVPDDPRAWLIRVASRRLIDARRRDTARLRREATAATLTPAGDLVAPPAEDGRTDGDDTLAVLLLCAHPALSAASQVSLTLRAVGGLSTAQIARAFVVSESTMAQRISRAKQTIHEAGARFQPPEPSELPARTAAVLHVLYLIFNEGYTATDGADLQSVELAREAIRLTRIARAVLPDDGEASGLLALMLLTDARRSARQRADGTLVPLGEQDRTRWNRTQIDEGIDLITATLAHAAVGPYQLQAAIAAIHAEAVTTEATDWRQIDALYQLLERFGRNIMVTLNRSVAAAMAYGPERGFAVLRTIEDDPRLARHHRLHAVRAHLLEMSGDNRRAAESYRLAARLSTSLPEQAHLTARADRLET
ncbi:MAG TPA: sigma-70 family RNA polymerase sigma factor [Micromonosporaceae bacterium]